MTRLEAALLEVVVALDDLAIPYMLVGGLAVAQWEEPRSTIDIDITVWVEPHRMEATITALASRLAPKTPDPLTFVRETHVLPATTSQGISVDLIFAAWPIEREAIQNAVQRSIGGHSLRLAPLEYLLFMKFSSERNKDFDDAVRLLRRHRGQVDEQWLDARLSEMSEALGQPSITQRFRRALREP